MLAIVLLATGVTFATAQTTKKDLKNKKEVKIETVKSSDSKMKMDTPAVVTEVQVEATEATPAEMTVQAADSTKMPEKTTGVKQATKEEIE